MKMVVFPVCQLAGTSTHTAVKVALPGRRPEVGRLGVSVKCWNEGCPKYGRR